MSAHRPINVPVGGFLGSGKTTLLLTAARVLIERGLRPAIVVNDQGADLVDTDWASFHDLATAEVTGGCFCCRFSGFLEAAERVRDADVIFAEPVGSCTDLAATILAPLKDEFLHRFRLAPLTVVVDPLRVDQLRADPDTAFLFENQLAEADLVCFSKSDVCAEYPVLEAVTARRLSGRTGEGVQSWLDEVLYAELPSGRRILDIDYERYAAAEAALAWFNCTVEYRPAVPVSPPMVVGPLLESLDRTIMGIVHLKLLDRASSGVLKAAITQNGQEPEVEGDLSASPAAHHSILINLRALADPELLSSLVREALPAGARMERVQSFRPAPPKPERRVLAKT